MQLGGYSESEARYFIAAKPLNDNSLTENCMSLSSKENESLLSQELLKELVHYNPATGIFTWKQKSLKHTRDYKRLNSRYEGTEAGSYDVHGYLRLSINYITYKAHRIAWFYVHGVWPEYVDHINHVRDDNRIANLRDVDCVENGKNHTLSITNKSGVTGVCWNTKTHVWHASIYYSNKLDNLGVFKDKFEAICARKSANNKYGFSQSHGEPKK